MKYKEVLIELIKVVDINNDDLKNNLIQDIYKMEEEEAKIFYVIFTAKDEQEYQNALFSLIEREKKRIEYIKGIISKIKMCYKDMLRTIERFENKKESNEIENELLNL